MEKNNLLYEGKAKSLYACDDSTKLIMSFRDDTSAFDGEKVEQLANKGAVNNAFNAFIMTKLQEAGVPTHYEQTLNDTDSLVKHLEMIPVECVVRNISAGSFCKRLGVEEGIDLDPIIFEFFMKDDPLHDPMINDYHIRYFGFATDDEMQQMQTLSFIVNDVLKKLFGDAGMLLVDYKLEFGRFDGQLVLGDEFTPDGCRIWDAETREKLDKDRFRKDMGDVVESYQLVAERLGVS